jgi:hypothetical protein
VTTNEWVAVFVGIVTAITTIVGGAIRSSRASQLRKGIAEDQAIVKSLPPEHGARPALDDGIERQSAELAALVLHPMKASAFIAAFLVFLMWGVVLIVYLTEGFGPLTFTEGVGRGLVNWAYIVTGLVALVFFVREARRVRFERARTRKRILGGADADQREAGRGTTPPASS